MTGSELIVALFALVFLAFCLTAIAFIAMSKDKDDIAEKSVTALHHLQSDKSSEAKDSGLKTAEEPAEGPMEVE